MSKQYNEETRLSSDKWVNFCNAIRQHGKGNTRDKTLLFPARNCSGGGSPEGAEIPLFTFQPPLGVLWLLSGAPESNIVASAEAMNATTKIKQEERKRLRRAKSRVPAFCAQKRPFTRTQCHPSTAPAAAALRSRADTASIPRPRRCLPECSTPRHCQSTASHPQ